MITVLFGAHRWRRRRAVARLGFAEIDPFGRPGFLYLTDTHRKRTVVAREFVGRDVFEPPGRVLGELWGELWDRWGDGRPMLSARAAWLLALDVVEGSPLSALGEVDAVARQVADLASRLAEAEVPVELRPEVTAAISALRARWDAPTHVDPATAIHALIPRLRSPSPGLARWLAGLPPLVLDDVLQQSALRTRALLALLDAAHRVGRPAIVAFESDGSMDDAEVGLFFGAEDHRAHRAFAATRRLRAAVFERFVATGSADVLEAREDGPVPAGAPATPEAAPRPLAEAVWVRRAPSVRDEVEHVAQAVREELLAGTPAVRCHVALADPDRYRHVLVEIFARYGIPIDLADGAPLAATPLGQLALVLARWTLREPSPDDRLALADLAGEDLDALHASLAPAGVRGGPPEAWRARLFGWARRTGVDEEPLQHSLQAVEAVSALCRDLATERTAAGWAHVWRATAEALGAERLAERSDANRRAWGAVCRLFEEVAVDLAVADPGTWSAERAGRALAHAIRSSRWVGSAAGGVPVTGLLELRGLSPVRVWVLGLTRRRWPAPHAPDALVDVATRRLLEPVDRLAEARYLLGSLVRLATGDPSARGLWLSWPALDGGRPAAPSTVLVDWLEQTGARAVDLAPLEPIPTAPLPAPSAGRLDRPPPAPAALSVTRAETALRCAARFWYGELLDLEPHDPWDPELEPRQRGTAVHAIFQGFYEGRGNRAVQPSERSVARAELLAVARRVLDRVEAEGGFEPALQAWARDRWLAGLADDRPAGLLAAWLEHEIDGGTGPVDVERAIQLDLGGLALIGKLDRVDRDASGAWRVVDYKTGSAPTRERTEAGLALQPLVYTEAVARERGGPVASAFQLVSRPDAIRYAGWYGDADAIEAWGGRRGLEQGADARAVQLEAAHVRLMEVLAGDVTTTVHGPELAGCDTCRFRRVCRTEQAC